MRVTRHATAAAFLDAAREFLLRDEVENLIVLGIASDMGDGPVVDGPWLATVAERGETVACALRISHRPLVILTRAPEAAVEALAAEMTAWGVEVTETVGPAETVGRFARLWSRRTGKPARMGTRQLLYRLDAVEPGLRPCPGRLRQAGAADLERVTEWIEAFQQEAMPMGDSRQLAAAKIRQGAVFLWDDPEPVTMAAWAGPTPHGIRLNLVYTPPELRGRGYATACVAALSRRLLEEGRRFCALYADLANPASNAVYRRIGYRPVCGVDEILFG